MKKDSMSFEASLQRLEEIVRQLQNGTIPLDDALGLFQEGTALITQATKLLDEAELKVRQFSGTPAGAGEDADDDDIPF